MYGTGSHQEGTLRWRQLAAETSREDKRLGHTSQSVLINPSQNDGARVILVSINHPLTQPLIHCWSIYKELQTYSSYSLIYNVVEGILEIRDIIKINNFK